MPHFCGSQKSVNGLAVCLTEELFHFLCEAAFFLIAAVVQLLVHFFNCLLLCSAELGRYFQVNRDHQVAHASGSQTLDALTFQTENRPRLCACRNMVADFSVQCRNSDVTSESCLFKCDRDFNAKIRSRSLKQRVVLYTENDIQISCRAAVFARFTLSSDRNYRIGIYACRDIDIDLDLFSDLSGSAAIRTRCIDDLSGASAVRAR